MDKDAVTPEEARDGALIIEYVCPGCGKTTRFPAERFDLDAPHVCPFCGRPVFETEPDGIRS